MLIGAVVVCSLTAQNVETNEAALLYYSPKTTVALDFTYTVETRTRGQYAEFAEAMLGASDAIMETGTVCELQEVRIGTYTAADLDRPHKLTAEAGIPMLLQINEKGILAGYNLPYEKPNTPPRKICSEKEKVQPIAIPPFAEEVLEAATPLAQANAIVKQIFRLRETRTYLLSGEVEHAPADGKAMQLVLDELRQQEQALTELFIGKRTTRTEHKEFRFDPTSETPIWFFSEENGFTAADNIDADTIRVNVALQPQVLTPAAEPTNKKKTKSPELSPIVYNLPGSADISVTFKDKTLGQKTLPIAQLGVDVPLAKDLFTGAELPTIVFNEKTGNVISINK